MKKLNELFPGEHVIPVVRNLTIVSFIFCLVFGLVLILNYIQLKVTDPLDSPALEKLVMELQDDAENQQLRSQVRELNLYSRKAFFTGLNQIKTGSYILFAVFLIFCASLKLLTRLSPAVSRGESKKSPSKLWLEKGSYRIIIFASLLIVTTTALALSFVSANDFKDEVLFSKKSDTKKQPSAYKADEKLLRNWPAFRGPFGQGVSYASNLPENWDGLSGENILWKKKLTRSGFSSPVVWEDKIFLTLADQEAREVACFDLNTGEKIFGTIVKDIPSSSSLFPEVADDTGYGAATCTTDGQRVYTVFATGLVTALDFTGKIIWEQNLGVPENHYGHSSSLVIFQDIVLVQFDQDSGGAVLGLDSETGKVLWQTERDVITSWSSPLVIPEEGKVLLNADPYAGCYNPVTGEQLWLVDIMSGEIGVSPAYKDGIAVFANKFAVLAAVDIESGEVLWEYFDNLPDVSSPVVIGSYIIMTDAVGTMSCLDLKSGDVVWEHEFDEGFYCSPIAAGPYVYVTDLEGLTHIVRPGPEFDLVASCPVGEKVVSTPAFVDNKIVIRGVNTLYCIGQ